MVQSVMLCTLCVKGTYADGENKYWTAWFGSEETAKKLPGTKLRQQIYREQFFGVGDGGRGRGNSLMSWKDITIASTIGTSTRTTTRVSFFTAMSKADERTGVRSVLKCTSRFISVMMMRVKMGGQKADEFV